MTLKQKVTQSALVWLVPVGGAILMSIFMSANREQPHTTSQHVRDENDEAFRIGQSSHHHEP